MHYIRFLKSPFLSSGKKGLQVQAKITITTDLGESFLYFDLPILAILIDSAGNQAHVHPYLWKMGIRELDMSFFLPLTTLSRPRWPCSLLVRPKDAVYQLRSLGDLLLPLNNKLGESHGLVLPVWSEKLFDGAPSNKPQYEHVSSLEPAMEGQLTSTPRLSQPKRLARHIDTTGTDEICVWEETGESIARHIWDAGLVLSAFLASFAGSKESSGLKFPEFLKTLVTKKSFGVLELGTGCGIVGMTMATSYPNVEVLITDLPEAEDIARINIYSASKQPHSAGASTNLRYQNLDWEESLPQNLRTGNLDLILVADCTYNSDVVPNLVNTLSNLLKYNQGIFILVAMKIRHDSESVFFELMSQRGIKASEKFLVPLPLLGQGLEEIEIHTFEGN